MTAIVGVLCRNGIVIGTDSAATFSANPGFRVIEQPTDKIYIIEDKIILSGTGAVGFNQRFVQIVRKAWGDKLFQNKTAVDVGKIVSQFMIKDLRETFVQKIDFGALLAFEVKGVAHLCEFDPVSFQPELKGDGIWFCTMGSTQYMTDPFLGLLRKVFWDEKQPDVHDGIFATTWALDHAVELNPGGVNDPIKLAVMETDKKGKYKSRIMDDYELQEIRQNIEEAKQSLRDIRLKQTSSVTEDIPQVPKPNSSDVI